MKSKMIDKGIWLAMACLTIGLSAWGQQPMPVPVKELGECAEVYLGKALSIMRNRAVNSDKLNWNKIYSDAYNMAKGASRPVETYPTIRYVLEKLEDGHSKFFTPEQVSAYLLGYRKTGQPFPVIGSTILEGGYAYIQLPSFASYNFAEWDEYVDTFWKKVSELEAGQPLVWIIDMRNNEGGMFTPMYFAISPFLNRSKAIGWRDGRKKDHFMEVKKGRFLEDGIERYRLGFPYRKVEVRKKQIVILINKRTASSGEFAAIAFAGQKNVAFAGAATMGLTSANQEHRLSDDAFLVITEGSTIDRKFRAYDEIGKGLQPDYYLGEAAQGLKGEQRYLRKVVERIINLYK